MNPLCSLIARAYIFNCQKCIECSFLMRALYSFFFAHITALCLQVPRKAMNGDVSSLMNLVLSQNSITTVPSAAFVRLTYLQKLDLSENKIEVVERGAFQGLAHLQRIYLNTNRITHLRASDLPPSLHGITLHENR